MASVIMITGASGNLGRAVAAAFESAGASLALVDRRRDRLEAGYGNETAHRLHLAADLTDAGAVDAAVQATLERFGRIDTLCNIAGAFRMGPAAHETPDTDWTFLFDVNALSVIHMARAVVPHMLAAGRGRIVNVGAFSALEGAPHMAAYVAAKSAVIRITESMSAELRERGINVNCVLPGTIDTPENRRAMPRADPAKWVAPADLANVIVFLASDAARAVHGAAIPVTGLG